MMVRRLIDFAQASLTGTLMAVGTYAVQLDTPLGAGQQEKLVEYMLKEGGLLVVLVIVLFYYRRDYRDVRDYLKAQNDRLITLVESNTKAQVDTANAVREATIVSHQTKRMLYEFFPERRRDIADALGP